ncbi:dynamin family protein [Streptomyces luteocolor]|uniref:dynamin family protein n=1 Tax=Streptomyces luteocolor TaxID=285500 RepID=UPI000852DF79|nr:dynamin family protein [Streptomyces luteocolor]
MRTYDTLRAEVLGLFEGLVRQAEEQQAAETLRRLRAAHDRLRDGRLTVVVCGEFKRGKSSLLGALLEDPDLFPVDTTYATRLVTTVRYGDTERITVTLQGDGEDTAGDEGGAGTTESRAIGRSEIADYVTEGGNPHNVRRARLLEVETPNRRLGSGIVVVDTPGIGGAYREHTAVTAAFLPSADALLFVADATQPLTESELVFLRQATAAAEVTDDVDGIVFVLTKTDVPTDSTGIRENTVAKLAEATGCAPDALPLVAVSNLAKQRHLESGSDRHLRLSNFPALETLLWQALERRRAKLLLGGALADLDGAALALLRPVETELEILTQRTEDELARLTEELEGEKRRLAGFALGEAGWRAELRRQFTALGRRLGSEGHAGIERVWNTFQTDYLFRDLFLAEPERLVGQLSADAAAVVAGVNELARRRSARILREFSAAHGLDLAEQKVGALPDPPVPPLEVTGRLGGEIPPGTGTRHVRETSFATSTGAAMGFAVGNFALPFVGGALGTAVGALLGAGIGLLTSVRVQRYAERQQERTSLQTQLAPLRATQQRHIEDAVAGMRDELIVAVVAELDSRIRQEQESVAASLARIKDARAATRAQAAERTTRLRQRRVPLLDVRRNVESLRTEAAALGRAGQGAPAPEDAGSAAAPQGSGSAAAPQGSGSTAAPDGARQPEDDDGWADA